MLEVILAVLLCALGFFLYLTDRNKHEIFCLKQALRDKELEIETLRRKIDAFQKSTTKRQKNSQPQLPLPASEIFVSVIFREGDRKSYDYFVGDNDVQVGDFVEVYFNNRSSGQVERRAAKVIYVSEPGEVSEYARSEIKCKSDRNKW